MKKKKIDPASFKDPSGLVFFIDNTPYRQINKSYKDNYLHLMQSGLYQSLYKEGLLIGHKEVKEKNLKSQPEAYKTIKPTKIDFISYPYEWSPSLFKDAALLTLKIQRIALEHGMMLKDATPYNVQWFQGKTVFIDTLSFEKLEDNLAWPAYRQFCESFLAPLALTYYKKENFIVLLRKYINGIPLGFTSKLLPKSALFNKGILMHIYLHSKTQNRVQTNFDLDKDNSKLVLDKNKLLALNDSLIKTITGMMQEQSTTKSEWLDYYSSTNYSKNAFKDKEKIIKDFVKKVGPEKIWDLGSNEGYFSDLVCKKGRSCVAFDQDYLVVDRYYNKLKKQSNEDIVPLVMDLSNPSPNLGWANQERISMIRRGPVDLTLALALIHHLYFKYNIAFAQIITFLSKISNHSIIEFISIEDSNVKKISGNRKDLLKRYDRELFENELKKRFKIVEKKKIKDSYRYLYLVKNNEKDN